MGLCKDTTNLRSVIKDRPQEIEMLADIYQRLACFDRALGAGLEQSPDHPMRDVPGSGSSALVQAHKFSVRVLRDIPHTDQIVAQLQENCSYCI